MWAEQEICDLLQKHTTDDVDICQNSGATCSGEIVYNPDGFEPKPQRMDVARAEAQCCSLKRADPPLK